MVRSLWSAGRAGAAALLILVAAFPAVADPLTRTVINLLGTTCEITLYAGSAASAFDAAFARIAEIDTAMTINKPDSEVVRVNKAAGLRPVKVAPDVYFVIKRGLEFSMLGNGAFDITVAPLVSLWGIGTAKARVPLPDEIRGTLALVGYRNLELQDAGSTVFLKKPGMGIDLGSIAKGYAADEAARVLAENGVTSALINLGGNILTMGKKPDGTLWRIGIQNPEEPRGTPVGIIELSRGSVTTAGTYERFFVSGEKRYFHILDARTGYPAWNGLAAVSIVAGDSLTADGYDTVVFTLGLNGGRALVAGAHGAIEAVFITEKREIYVTPGLRPRFTLSDSRFTMIK
jgi:thiamine biosynthesis lipoprotein